MEDFTGEELVLLITVVNKEIKDEDIMLAKLRIRKAANTDVFKSISRKQGNLICAARKLADCLKTISDEHI